MTVKTFLKAALATAVFATVHSALASRQAKHAAGRLVGEERRDATYRVFYVAQSLCGFAGLVAFTASLPKRTVYRVQGPAAHLLRLGQAAGVMHLIAGLREIGVMRWAGLYNFAAWRTGGPIPEGPVAQGPELQVDGRLSTDGPFRWSRHPLNFSGIPIFWFTPHMTTRRLGFNLASTLYFILGSAHEEARLKEAYGDVYRGYLARDVPFFLPLRRGDRGREEVAGPL